MKLCQKFHKFSCMITRNNQTHTSSFRTRYVYAYMQSKIMREIISLSCFKFSSFFFFFYFLFCMHGIILRLLNLKRNFSRSYLTLEGSSTWNFALLNKIINNWNFRFLKMYILWMRICYSALSNNLKKKSFL